MVFRNESYASPPPQAMKAGFKNLKFKDEFNSLKINDGKWYNGLWYKPESKIENFQIKNGILTIISPPSININSKSSSSSLTTFPKNFHGHKSIFHYGYFEARIRFTPSQYNWPAFWLLSDQRPAMGDGNGIGHWCEVDIFEGGQENDFWGTVHDWNNNQSTENKNQHNHISADVDYRKWNNVGLLWEPGKISWFLNNKLINSINSPSICDQQNAFLIIGSQNRRGNKSETSFDIDWIHVYR